MRIHGNHGLTSVTYKDLAGAMRIGDRKGRWLRGGRGLRHGVLASRQEGWPVRGSQDIRPRARSLEGPGTIVEAQGRGPSCPCPGMESSGKQSGPRRGLGWSAHTERAARGAPVAGASLKAPLSASKPRAAPGDSVGSPVASQHRRSDARGAESSAGRGPVPGVPRDRSVPASSKLQLSELLDTAGAGTVLSPWDEAGLSSP